MLRAAGDAGDELMTLRPKAHFVVKTKLAEDTAQPVREKGTKVFLNICSDDQVPLPEVGYDPQVIYPMIMDNQWEIPIVTSQERVDTDKKGQRAYVYDCIVNTKAIRWIQTDRELKDILIEWTLESAELRSDISLSREHIALPKLTSKGEVQELQMHRSELDINRLNKEFERVSNLQSEPQSILEARRIDEEEIDEARGNISIFNGPSVSEKTENGTKPLIEEITNMSIRSPPKPHEPVIKPQLEYSTTMHKIDTNGYKLKIEIKSQNTSSLDYDLNLDTETNTIILKNLNPQFTAKDLELPLPTIFTAPEIKTFFIHDDTTLAIFVK